MEMNVNYVQKIEKDHKEKEFRAYRHNLDLI
jgi:hypothetical protein